MERTFKKVTEAHLTDYLPKTIKKYGHAILHGDGNIYVDVEGVQKEHQRSYLAKNFAAAGNDAGTYVLRFDNVKDIPEDLDNLDKAFLNAKALEKVEEGKIKSKSDFLSIGVDTEKTASENVDLKAQLDEKNAENEALKKQLAELQNKPKPGRRPKDESDETE